MASRARMLVNVPIKAGRVAMSSFEGMYSVAQMDCLMFLILLLLVMAVSVQSTQISAILNAETRNIILLQSCCNESIDRDTLSD